MRGRKRSSKSPLSPNSLSDGQIALNSATSGSDAAATQTTNRALFFLAQRGAVDGDSYKAASCAADGVKGGAPLCKVQQGSGRGLEPFPTNVDRRSSPALRTADWRSVCTYGGDRLDIARRAA